MRIIQLLTVSLMLGSLFSCVSMSSLQTARTLEDGEDQQTFGGGVYQSKTETEGVDIDTNLPYVEYSYREGFAKNWDAGFKLTFIGAYSADAKYQIYSDDKFAFSTGLGLGYLSYKITSGNTEQEVKFLDFMLPLYLSYDFTPSFALYTAPKFIVRKVSGTDSDTQNITGITVGTKIGQKSGIYLEASLIKGEGNDNITQYNASYFW